MTTDKLNAEQRARKERRVSPLGVTLIVIFAIFAVSFVAAAVSPSMSDDNFTRGLQICARSLIRLEGCG